MELGVYGKNPFLIFNFEIFGAFLPRGHQRRTGSKKRPWKIRGIGPILSSFRGKNENAFCRRCGVHEEYVEHLWECSLSENKNLPNFTNMTKNNPKVLSIIQKYVEKFINKRS